MTRPLIWTDEKVNALRKLLHMTNKQLAQHFDTTVAMIKWVKHKEGLRKMKYK